MINLYDVIQIANGQLFGEPVAQIFTDFTLDPDDVDASLLYVALPVEQGDTEATLCRAIRNGVGGVLCVEPPSCDTTGVSVVMVPDPVDALLAWSRLVLERMQVKTVVITGADSKSTAVRIIGDVLSLQYNVHAVSVDMDGRLSLPLSLATLGTDHDMVVVKLAVEHYGDMRAFLEVFKPDVAVLLSLDCTHTAQLSSCEEYVQEHRHLFDALGGDGLVVVNFDDDLAMQAVAQSPAQRLTIGIERFGADMMAFNVVSGARRTGFDLRIGSERYVGRWTPLLGRYHLYGVLAGVAIGQYYDIPIEDILRMLTAVSPLKGRLNPLVGIHESLVIDDTYRATAASSLASLDLLAHMHTSYKRRFFILGDMDEVGVHEVLGYRQVGQRAAEVVDVLITMGMQASITARAALDAGMSARAIHMTYSPQDAVVALQNYDITAEDVIIVKGGAHARMEQVVAALLHDEEDAPRLVRQTSSNKQIRRAFHPIRPSWIELSAHQLAQNVQTIRASLPSHVDMMAVVKANGYGHGAVMAARTALQNGATYLAVANLAEAIELRDAGIDAPTLILSYLPVDAVRQAIQYNLTATIFDLEMARHYNRIARDVGMPLKYHVKVDTGMGRLGILPGDAIYIFRHLNALPHLTLEGIYTHFSVADEDEDYTQKQVQIFRDILRPLGAAGIQFKHIHAANSPAILYRKDVHFNMVRLGLAMYGMNPSSKENLPAGIAPLLAWKTTILQIKTLPAGHPVGYGNTYRTRHEETIAVLPVGYADGFRRSPRTWRHVLINGQKAPIVGRISMEKTTVDISRIAEAQIGDEVVLIGSQGDAQISVDDVANWLGTINYEVVTTLSQTIPRILKSL